MEEKTARANNLTFDIVFRELNVDGCGGFAEMPVNFPDGLTVEEIGILEKCVEEAKKEADVLDDDTDGIVMVALDKFKALTGHGWRDGNVSIIEF